jgi:hypothetical protein
MPVPAFRTVLLSAALLLLFLHAPSVNAMCVNAARNTVFALDELSKTKVIFLRGEH